jgi:hypothetical protein
MDAAGRFAMGRGDSFVVLVVVVVFLFTFVSTVGSRET